MVYLGVTVEKNVHGFYAAWLDNAGRYCQCDTLKGCKEMIKKDKEKSKELSCN